ncbi:MAG: hypothetical protein DLM54_02520 [Acidimicrobiales bacterium]|nr:MAG: hypothetical protein DLM54_02520 [Acidimicrobiales bacterium]
MNDEIGPGDSYTPMPGEPPRTPLPSHGPAPGSVATAVRLMLIRAALGVVSIIVVLATKDTLKAVIRAHNHTVGAANLDGLVNTAVTVGLVIGIIFIVLYVVLALQVRQAKNWARITTWVIAGLGVLSALGSLAQPEPAISRLVALISGILDIAIIVLLAQRPSNRYFRPTR